jgi:hypothetical protein
MGAGKPRRRRALREGSRHVPVEIARSVWERDEGRCTFVDAEGRRCSERRFLTLEHRFPFAMGGTSLDADNLCLFCRAHNNHTARQAYGAEYIARKRAERARRRREKASAESNPRVTQSESEFEAQGRTAREARSSGANGSDLPGIAAAHQGSSDRQEAGETDCLGGARAMTCNSESAPPQQSKHTEECTHSEQRVRGTEGVRTGEDVRGAGDVRREGGVRGAGDVRREEGVRGAGDVHTVQNVRRGQEVGRGQDDRTKGLRSQQFVGAERVARAQQPELADRVLREQVLGALCGMGFRKNDATAALDAVSCEGGAAPELLRAAIQRLTPDVPRRA